MSSILFSITAPPLDQDLTENDLPNVASALLSTSNSVSGFRRSRTAFLFSALLVTTCTSVVVAAAFAFLFFFASSASTTSSIVGQDSIIGAPNLSRSLAKLSRPMVLLILSYGFCFSYQFKTHAPNIHRLIDNGTEAATGLIPVFPTLTFPNHYSIITGLYLAYHGVINNHFVNLISGASFSMNNHEPEWWLGQPLETTTQAR